MVRMYACPQKSIHIASVLCLGFCEELNIMNLEVLCLILGSQSRSRSNKEDFLYIAGSSDILIA